MGNGLNMNNCNHNESNAQMSAGGISAATTSSSSSVHLPPPPPPNQTSVIQSTKSYQNGTGNGNNSTNASSSNNSNNNSSSGSSCSSSSSSSFLGGVGNGSGSGSGNMGSNDIVLFGNGERSSNGNVAETSNTIVQAKERKLFTAAGTSSGSSGTCGTCSAEFGAKVNPIESMSMETIAITRPSTTTAATTSNSGGAASSTNITYSNIDNADNMDITPTTESGILSATNINHSIATATAATSSSSTVINTDNGFRNQKYVAFLVFVIVCFDET